MNQKYDADYFINLFSTIPDEEWTTGAGGVHPGTPSPSCALGHLGTYYDKRGEYVLTKHGKALAKLLAPFAKSPEQSGASVVYSVNDGTAPGFESPHSPKARILAALERVKKQEAK